MKNIDIKETFQSIGEQQLNTASLISIPEKFKCYKNRNQCTRVFPTRFYSPRLSCNLELFVRVHLPKRSTENIKFVINICLKPIQLQSVGDMEHHFGKNSI